ncbi:hypothetical protein DUI87_17175 [Hirundo rustica rustica]|uniref:Uncharacterized protein n=1 Tax=Hirundo rustica rustica TaxID=333673 RepID=A0A3M0K3R6_HIRRU|nr:hypothetical protein DUI87_17175 [Hirundo rustica rustica]
MLNTGQEQPAKDNNKIPSQVTAIAAPAYPNRNDIESKGLIRSILEQIYKITLHVAVPKLERKGYGTESGLFSLHLDTAEPTLARGVEGK